MALPPACTAALRHPFAPAPLPAVPVDLTSCGPLVYHATLPDLAAAVVADHSSRRAVAVATAAVAAATLAEPPPAYTNVPLTTGRMELPRRAHSPPTVASSSTTAADSVLGTVRHGGVHKPKMSMSSASSASTAGNRTSKRSGESKAMRASSTPNHAAAGSDDDENDGDEDDEDDDNDNNGGGTGAGAGGPNRTIERQRRQRFLERNRIAASKCRQKKKMWVQELERRAEDVTMQNRSLHITIAQLKDEVMVLKSQLLAHHNCGCSVIHQYLQAERAVSEIMPAGISLATPHQPPLMPPPPPPPPPPHRQLHYHHHPADPSAAVAAAAVAVVAAGGATGTVGPPLLLQPQPQTQAALIVQQHRIPSPPAYAPQPHAPSGALAAAAQSPALSVAPGTFGWTPSHRL